MFSSLSYFWGETFRSLFRNRFMAIASVLTVTLSMFILGVFLSAVLNINHMASYLENQVEMTVYLKDGLTTDQVMGIGKYLKAQPGMKEIKFTNKDQAMKDFRERMGDQQGRCAWDKDTAYEAQRIYYIAVLIVGSNCSTKAQATEHLASFYFQPRGFWDQRVPDSSTDVYGSST